MKINFDRFVLKENGSGNKNFKVLIAKTCLKIDFLSNFRFFCKISMKINFDRFDLKENGSGISNFKVLRGKTCIKIDF